MPSAAEASCVRQQLIYHCTRDASAALGMTFFFNSLTFLPVMLPQRLLFVYNADGGRLAGLKDMFHKILFPATYPCSLCALTYGATTMRPAWREFIRKLPVPVDFLHRDEFIRDYPAWARHPLPAAFEMIEAGELAPFIEAEEMDSADLNGLMERVRQRLA